MRWRWGLARGRAAAANPSFYSEIFKAAAETAAFARTGAAALRRTRPIP